MAEMNEITKKLLSLISDWDGNYKGAYSIRQDGSCIGKLSTDHISVNPKTDKPGLDIKVEDGTKGETVSIPACVTHGDENDMVYNDFYVGEDCDITVMAGCGVHTETGEPARHNGIHRFFIGKNAKVKYVEKHIGTGEGKGIRSIDPVTEVYLEEGSVLEMDTAQIGGVDKSLRTTSGTIGENARLIIRERIMTEKEQTASTEFCVEMNGKGSGVDLISRSVAKDNSYQSYHSTIIGNAPCTGHSECDAIISGNGKVDAAPELKARCEDATLIHEAAIGKIAGEQILKLRTLGLTEQEAEATIVEGFLS